MTSNKNHLTNLFIVFCFFFTLDGYYFNVYLEWYHPDLLIAFFSSFLILCKWFVHVYQLIFAHPTIKNILWYVNSFLMSHSYFLNLSLAKNKKVIWSFKLNIVYHTVKTWKGKLVYLFDIRMSFKDMNIKLISYQNSFDLSLWKKTISTW